MLFEIANVAQVAGQIYSASLQQALAAPKHPHERIERKTNQPDFKW
jgi:hypothetical protein